MRYKKKPITIEAIQINANPSDIKAFAGDTCKIDYSDAAWEVGKGKPMMYITIHTLEGDMIACEGDYIVRGVKGELYPCRKDIFEETYELEEKLHG